ncbi:MAG: helix-turn-helix transcriptional regulator [Defluviitaleaceae bacterium]|nr:helix-turn-helix transcriptional regulator [Defluviitaleaceae bacterium]
MADRAVAFINQLRHTKGVWHGKPFKLQEAAKELGVSRTCYASWEQGRNKPNIDGVTKPCKFFDVSSDYLIGLEDKDKMKFLQHDKI